MTESCASCRFYSPSEHGEGRGLCRRYPPGKYEFMQKQYAGGWPVFAETDWCGEWRERHG